MHKELLHIIPRQTTLKTFHYANPSSLRLCNSCIKRREALLIPCNKVPSKSKMILQVVLLAVKQNLFDSSKDITNGDRYAGLNFISDAGLNFISDHDTVKAFL